MIVINPGSGPVGGASREHAVANMRVFVDDLRRLGARYVVLADPIQDMGDGRWEFSLAVDGQVHTVEMPGLPIDQVRWVDEAAQNIWDFPRLYVDGSSWVWKYALDACLVEEEEPA